MSDYSFWSTLLYWRHKTPQDNQWRPVPGEDPRLPPGTPALFRRWDIEALAVDTAPFILGMGIWAYLSQARDFGFTANANVFKNKPTIAAMGVAAGISAIPITACQLLGIEYRYYIPRWANERELRRDNDEVRQHVFYGMLAGATTIVFRPLPSNVFANAMLGGALADVLLREYVRAHSM